VGRAGLPADEIECVIVTGLKEHLHNTSWLSDQLKRHATDPALAADILRAASVDQFDPDGSEATTHTQAILNIVTRVEAEKDRMFVSVNLAEVLEQNEPGNPIPEKFEIPFQKRQNGRAKPIVIATKDAAQQDPDLIALVADARRWASELLESKSLTIQQITEREGLRSGSVSRVLPLTWLAPDITMAILEGRQPNRLSVKTLRDLPDLPLDWMQQRKVLGFAHA
jgi:hypothetical protein